MKSGVRKVGVRIPASSKFRPIHSTMYRQRGSRGGMHGNNFGMESQMGGSMQGGMHRGNFGMDSGMQGGMHGSNFGMDSGTQGGMRGGNFGMDSGMQGGMRGGNFGMDSGTQGGMHGGNFGMDSGTQGDMRGGNFGMDSGMQGGMRGGNFGMHSGTQGGMRGGNFGMDSGTQGTMHGGNFGMDSGMQGGMRGGNFGMDSGMQGSMHGSNFGMDPDMQGGMHGGNFGMDSGMGGDMVRSRGYRAQGGRKRTYDESQDGYSMDSEYDTSRTAQYSSYFENWHSGYKGSGNGQGNYQAIDGRSRNRGSQNRGGQNRGGQNRGYQQRGTTMGPTQWSQGGRTREPSTFTGSYITIAEKIRKFGELLQDQVVKVNAIQTIDNLLTGSGIPLQLGTEYQADELVGVIGRWLYTGCFKIGGVFIVRTVGTNKKDIKRDVYAQALEILKTKTVAQMKAARDPGVEYIKSELSSRLEDKKEIMEKCEIVEFAKQAVVEMTKLFNTRHDGFAKLMTHLKESTLPPSPISSVVQGISASHCNFTQSFQGLMVRLPTGKLFFRGTLTIADILIAVGVACNKKDAKMKTYEQALKVLKTKSIPQILKSMPEPCTLAETVPENTPAVPEKDRSNHTRLEKLTELTELVKEAESCDSKIRYLDVTAVNLDFTPICIYRKIFDGKQISCELYLDDVLIAGGEADGQRESRAAAYNNAWDLLCTTAPDCILEKHKRLKLDDPEDPSIVDVWVKGTGKPTANNNSTCLGRPRKIDETLKGVEGLVIMEHEEWEFDRKSNAFCILGHSCTFNGLLIQWESMREGNMFRSVIKLEDKVVGEASALGKNTSRSLAAASTLFKLYETQNVIRISRRDDTKSWIVYSEIQKEALRIASEEGEEANPPASYNKRVILIAEEMMKQHMAKQTLDELIFGPGMPDSEREKVIEIAQSLNLRPDVHKHQDGPYIIIHRKFTPQEMVEILIANGNKSGKYSLLDRSTLPSFSTIQSQLDKHKCMRTTTKKKRE